MSAWSMTRRRRRWAFRLGVALVELAATLAAGSLPPSGLAACGIAAAGIGLIVLAR